MTCSPLRRSWLGLQRWFGAPTPATRLGAFRAIVCLVALYDVMLYGGFVFADARDVSAGDPSRPWTPIFLFQLLHAEPLGRAEVDVLYTVAVTALLCGAVGLFSRLSCAVAAVCFYWWTGLAYSFGKPHHDKVALAITLAALPFARVGAGLALDALWRSRLRWPRARGRPRFVPGTPIRIAQVTLAIGYCGAGLSKLLLGGVDWFNGYTLQGIMHGHDGLLSRVVGQSPTLCQLQSIGVVAVQSMFPLVLVWPRTRWFFVPAAFGFHVMTWLTMDTGPYMRVWLMLFAFVPLERAPANVLAGLRKGPVRGVATALGVVGLGALIGWVASPPLPRAAVMAFAATLVALFAGYAYRELSGRRAEHRTSA